MNERIALYSASLYQISCEEKKTEEVYESLKDIEAVLKENSEYIKLLTSAELKAEEREGLVEEAFSGKAHIFCVNFMKILANKRIFDIMLPCIREYEKKYLKDNNIENANIITAIELSDEKKAEVVEKLNKATGKKINATFSVSEDIIGGIVVESENSGIDASVLGKLKVMKRHISKN